MRRSNAWRNGFAGAPANPLRQAFERRIFPVQTGDQIIVCGNGVFEMPYAAPIVTGHDCIRVKVEKGDEVLNNRVFYVDIQ